MVKCGKRGLLDVHDNSKADKTVILISVGTKREFMNDEFTCI